MAKSFGKENEDEGGEESESGGPPDPNQDGATCCEDEQDAPLQAQAILFAPEEIRDDAAEGQHLYLGFVRTEIRRNGMETPLPCLEREQSDVDPARLMQWTRAGEELRQLADAFSRSKERQSVKHRVEKLNLETLDFDNFFKLLEELFQGGGITRERILVLFFFCADVAIEALRRGCHRTFHHLLSWSIRYITTYVAQYVHSVGGWGVVLRQSLDIAYQVSACCAFVAVVAACVVYIRRNLS